MTIQWSPAPGYQVNHGTGTSSNRYKVEYMEGSPPQDRWKKCQDVISETRHTLENLEHYQEYRFCVRALYETAHDLSRCSKTCQGPISVLSDLAMTQPKLGE